MPDAARITLDPGQLHFTELNVEPVIPDTELEKYTTGRTWLTLFKLHKQYLRVLREHAEKYVPLSATIAQQVVPNDRQVVANLRRSILRIGGYQIWADVCRGDLARRRLIQLTIIAGAAGSLTITGAYARGQSFWFYLGQLLMVSATAGLASLLVLAAMGLKRLLAMSVSISGVAALALLTAVMVVVDNWHTAAGNVLFIGTMIALATVYFTLTVAYVTWRLARYAFDKSWKGWTADEVIETLVLVAWYLRQSDEQAHRPRAAAELLHVANCVERYLPRHLVRVPDSKLPSHRSHERFDEMAAAIHALVNDYLIPTATTMQVISDEVDHLIVAAAQGFWGDWNRTPVGENHTPWRPLRTRAAWPIAAGIAYAAVLTPILVLTNFSGDVIKAGALFVLAILPSLVSRKRA